MKILKRVLILAILIVIFQTVNSFATDITDVNLLEVSEEITAILDSEGTLTISGNGDMPNWTSLSETKTSAPWEDSKSKIKKVVVEDGVKNIGSFAFLHCENITEIIISETVEKIEGWAFFSCSSLPKVTMQNGVISIKVGEGSNKPYYLTGKGIKPTGDYVLSLIHI